MKKALLSLDSAIIETLAKRPMRLHELVEVEPVRNEALRVNRRRTGVSPSESADATVNERLQTLRRSGSIAYDPATSRWDISQ
jgi:hypothetical protein